ncbi:hypothetical protein AB0D08_39835 [Kitasatospora sp. NPDC048540]|uniref:hypothetical protein n=1 Tax=unclassified Kitasatospora TaxID=2633591 RepID=UPI00068D37FA|nr:hypothetical protein [Kitasatospora sp. MBT63]
MSDTASVDVGVELSAELVERVSAIDIPKASGMVCVRVPHDDGSGRRVQRVSLCAVTSGRFWPWPITWSVRA